MRGSSVLRTCVLGLVLVNLVFVQLTEAARLVWLLPLYGLTLLSPLLRPLQEKLVYRALWNTSVLAVFGVLVWHATGDDLRYVLEDGLVLAALCQVHLLNNLRAEQRPDLLFFNSFLIAVATGYLAPGLLYPIAFLAFVPLFVIAQLLRGIDEDGGELPASVERRVVRDGLLRSGVLLALTMLVFLFWPRDFHRPGLLVSKFDFASKNSSEIGFDDSLSLDNTGLATASGRVVMKVTLLRGAATDVSPLWRGATLEDTNGEEWWPRAEGDLAAQDSGDRTWTAERGELIRPAVAGGGPLVAVENVDPQADRLFTPLSAARIAPGEGLDVDQVRASLDATLRYGEPLLKRPPVNYELELEGGELPRRGGTTLDSLSSTLGRFAVVPPSRRVSSARVLAADLAQRLPPGVDQHELVTLFRDHLSTRFVYLPAGAEGSARSLSEFLAGKRGGHCEFFASALATMLRSREVPARVVTGYRSTEWNDEGRVLTFRRRHAHAWVEVLDPLAGWYTVDPTPELALEQGAAKWKQAVTAIAAAWDRLVDFDSEGRDAALAWMRALPGRTWAWVRTHSVHTAAALLALVAFDLLRRRRRTRPDRAVRSYRRVLRRSGLELRPGETPRELLERTAGLERPPASLGAVREATREHELARYGG